MRNEDREETTNYAVKQIDAFLARADYTSAILLASIYVEIRLTTLLTDSLSPSRKNWKAIEAVVKNVNFWQKVGFCKSKGLLPNDPMVERNLEKLRKKRNLSAHESALWRHASKSDMAAIKRTCEFAKAFLKTTT